MSKKNVLAALERVAEKRINEAIQRGEFDNLPGSGEPLNLEDDRQIPDDLRLAYKVLRNADCLPPELELKKEDWITIQQMMMMNLRNMKGKFFGM